MKTAGIPAPVAGRINVAAISVLLVGLAAAIWVNTSNAEAGASRETKAWALIEQGALLVDVRTKAEFDAGHLEGALHIPYTEVADRLPELGTDKSRAVVLYCQKGGRAGKAEKTLSAQGFTSLYNAGGYASMLAAKP